MRLCLLCRDCASDRVDDARKFHRQAVAGALDDGAVVLGDLGVDELAPQRLEAFERAFLVRFHQPRVARHIRGENGGEPAGRGHFCQIVKQLLIKISTFVALRTRYVAGQESTARECVCDK